MSLFSSTGCGKGLSLSGTLAVTRQELVWDHIFYQTIASVFDIVVARVTWCPRVRAKKFLDENELKNHSDMMLATRMWVNLVGFAHTCNGST